MPTPSHDDGAPSPPAHNFASCPEDLPLAAAARTSQATSDEDGEEVTALHSASSTNLMGEEARMGLDRDRLPSAQPSASSRATTASPRPQSSPADDQTDITSPDSAGADFEIQKEQNQDQQKGTDGPLSREASTKLQDEEVQGMSQVSDREAEALNFASLESEPSTLCFGPDFSSMRTIPISPSSYMRAGSRYHGTQQSERQVYEVQVEIKHVDMRESFLCGYLRIQGLTEDHPTLTTYFEGEIIGPKYNFITQHDDWGANTKVDLSHWAKFPAFKPYQKHARKGPITVVDVAQREFIFMRWKEHFLVPDHRVRTITGASFEGFYYICFNQVKGEVSGIYFHSKSERFQQLELKHVPDRGCFSSVEFR